MIVRFADDIDSTMMKSYIVQIDFDDCVIWNWEAEADGQWIARIKNGYGLNSKKFATFDDAYQWCRHGN